MQTIVNQITPSLLTINETMLKNNRKLKIPGYSCYNRNCQGVNGCGIATCVEGKDAMHTLKVFEGENEDEVLITRHSQFSVPINICNIYGEQESRSNKDKIQDKWSKILNEVTKIEAKGEHLVVIGDLNRHIGDMVEGNEKDKISFGGNLIKDWLETGSYVLVNASNKCVGGPFTRYDPADPNNDEKKSLLSLCIVSKELFPFIEKLVIDKEKLFTPLRPINSQKVVYTDHYSLLLVFKNIPLLMKKVIGGRKTIRWNTNKVGGWDAFSEMTKANEKLKEAAEDVSEDPNKIMSKIYNEMESVKFKAFGKSKEKSKIKVGKELAALQAEKIEICDKDMENLNDKVAVVDQKMSTLLLQKHREVFEAELKELRDTKKYKGKAVAVFKTKNKIVGNKAVVAEPVVLIDPKTKAEVDSPEGIRKVSLDYCTELLTNRKPKVNFEEDILMKEMMLHLRMDGDDDTDGELEELSETMFEKTYVSLSTRPGAKYNFIMKAGESLKPALFNLCKITWRTERLPERWEKSTLIQLYKGRGGRGVLDNQRHIHMKDEYPKYFGHLVVSAAKEKMIDNMTKFQIGTKPGHRAQEHLFVLKSVLALHLKYNKTVILSMWDVSKFFDREALSDCMNELYKNNIRGKLYRLLYQMNKNTRICVQTPVGLTNEKDTGEGVGQGTLEGALISAVNLDNGVDDFFRDSEYEATYEEVDLQPLLYQDDVARLSMDLESAQMGNDRMENMAETKLLNYNLEKSCFIVFGDRKARQKINEELVSRPLMLCGANMVQEEQAKYLGDQLCGLGLAESADATVRKRRGLVIMSIFEIRTVLEDCRSQVCGGISAGIDIWEMAVIPMLLNNADTWQDISDKTVEELDNLQKLFLRVLLSVGSGCPIPALFWETGLMLMKNRILQKKLLFLHHIAKLPEDTLAKEIYNVQKKLNLPGLVEECKEFLINSEVTHVENFSKHEWKHLVKKKMKEENKEDILDQMKGSKKLPVDQLKTEPFSMKSYLSELNMEDARLRFKINSGMTPTVKMNFKSEPEYTRDMWRCSGCLTEDNPMGNRDTQLHVMVCPGYEDYRKDKNLADDKDIVEYFKLVIDHRLNNI